MELKCKVCLEDGDKGKILEGPLKVNVRAVLPLFHSGWHRGQQETLLESNQGCCYDVARMVTTQLPTHSNLWVI